MTYIGLNLADAQLYYGTVYTNGRITGDPATAQYFGFPTVQLTDRTLFYEFVIDYVVTGANPEIFLESLNPAYEPDPSAWWRLAHRANRTGTTSISLVVGPGLDEWQLATDANEPGVLFETIGLEITGVRYRSSETMWPDGIYFGAPVPLDDTPSVSWAGYSDWLGYENYYSTGVPVYDDVVLVAWMHQGDGSGGGGEYAYEGRAVRYTEDENKVPTVELGPLAVGPLMRDVPGYGDPDYPYAANERINWVGRLGEGLALIQIDRNGLNPHNVIGYRVSVDPDTLEVTYLGSIHTDDPIRYPVGWSWAPAYGEDRVLFQIQHANAAPDGDRYLWSMNPQGEVVATRHVLSKPPGWTTTDPRFMWNNVMTIVDRGTEFISITLDYTTTSGVYAVSAWRHADLGGLPGDDPVRVAGPLPRGTEWDFDGTYAVPMGNGLVYIFEANYVAPGQGRVRVLDPDAGTITTKATTSLPYYYFSSHLLDYMSIQPMDETRAMIAWGERRTGTEDSGVWVAIFDGETLSGERMIYPYFANRSPYLRRTLYSMVNSEVYHLRYGKLIGVINGEEDNYPTPVSAADPGMSRQTWAVPARIEEVIPDIDGHQLESRRAFN